MTDIYALIVHPFEMGTEKDAANKVLEEASEVREAAQHIGCCLQYVPICTDCEDDGGRGACEVKYHLADEPADVIQAACNLAARYEIDLYAAMKRCEQRNRERGRYGSLQPEMTDGARAILDRMMEGANE